MKDGMRRARLEASIASRAEDLVLDIMKCAAAAPSGWTRLPWHWALWRLRLRHHLGQGELAARAGMTQAQISRLERGRDPKLSTLRRVYGAMDCELLVLPLPRPTVEAHFEGIDIP